MKCLIYLSPGRCKRQAITWPRIAFKAETSIVVIKDSQVLIRTSSLISWIVSPTQYAVRILNEIENNFRETFAR